MSDPNQFRSRGWNDPPIHLFTNEKSGVKTLNYRDRVGHDLVNDGIIYHHASPSCPDLLSLSQPGAPPRHFATSSSTQSSSVDPLIQKTMNRIASYLQNYTFKIIPESPDITKWLNSVHSALSYDNNYFYSSYINNFMTSLESECFGKTNEFLSDMVSWNQPWTQLFTLMANSNNQYFT
ncbi:hypothetical protein MXB_513 [Myxobolus squamalis]|nr:hypothetical protein MXB_513 [Myxobolus squamalis]